MHSVSDLTTFARKTKGDVPPPLVGASTTVVGNKMYLFGGRLVSLRKMVADMYEFDLQTYVWSRIEPKPDEEVPGPRYFHSADTWNNHLVIFGGMGYTESTSDELCVLSDVRVYSLSTMSWLPSTPVRTASAEETIDGIQVPPPRARYAHLSSITSSRLFIIGGQNLSNDWLDDIHVYDLPSSTWVMWKPYPRHCGTYRSVAVCATRRVRSPADELKAMAAAGGLAGSSRAGAGSPPPQGYAFLGPVGARFIPDRGMGSSVLRPMANHGDTAPDGPTPTRELVHLPYSCEPTDAFPNDIFIYSNYNFTDVRRELEVLTPLPNHDFGVEDRSQAMGGNSLPPGLRFPTGAILGHHLVISGTYLAHSYQSFSIWALDLVTMTWSRIDPGATLAAGSWSRGVLWDAGNRFLIFGNRDGNLVEDYNRRLLSWDHVAYIDLEAFGIYQPPELALSLASQELGLAALEEGSMADFELACDDGRRISCSRKMLEDRWPWFRDRRKEFVQAVHKALDGMPSGGKARGDVTMPDLPGALASWDKDTGRPDPRLTPRAFHLSEPYPVTLAFLQWMYSQALITRLQHSPPVLSALLLLGTTYKLDLLERQVRHAMHRALNAATSVGVYEVATLCDCQSLQIRALKVVMSSSRQRSSGRPRHQGGPSGGGGTSGPGDDAGARPRGMSDATSMPRRNGGPPGSGYLSGPAQSGPMSGPAANGYAQKNQQLPQLKLAITMPSNDGHAPESEEGMRSALGPGPDPSFKFGVTTPYTTAGTGAGFFDTNETLPSAIDPYGKSRAAFQPRRKDSTISGGESDGGSSSTDVGRFSQPRGRNQAVLRAQASESALNDRKMNQSPIDPGKVAPSVAEARMRRLLNELDAIGLTDDMTIGRPSLDGDDWAATSSNGHDSTPVAPLALSNRVPAGKIPPRHDDVTRAIHSANSSRDWARGISPINTRPVNNVQQQQMHRNYHPDAPESASPRSEDEDFYDPRPDMSPLTGGINGSALPPRQNSPPARGGPPPGRPPPQNMQGVYQPMRSAPLNSSAFPMPPRGSAPQAQQSPPLVTRTPRRPGTAGNDPPVSYFNNSGPNTAPVNRTRFGSDQNLRERYAASNLQAPASSPPQSVNQNGLSPVSPMSAPAMTLSSGSRTNSSISGALETPIEDPTPVTPLASVMNPSPKPVPSDTSNEKYIREKAPLRDTSSQEAPNYRLDSPPGGPRRGSVDAGTTLASPAEAERSRSPVVEQALSRLHQNPFLGGGLTFGGVGFALKDRDAGNPPPYRMHPSPSSGPNGRTNSLRAGSVGGRSDASGSSFGDGVSPKGGHGKGATPAVALATAFVRDGVPGLSAPMQPGMSKAEKAAEKARMKAEKAAQRAEEASRKVEEEREARLQAEALKKRKKEEKILKRLQGGEMGLHGFNGMGMLH